MARVISVEAERFPIAGTFTISRGSKTEAEVITCRRQVVANGGVADRQLAIVEIRPWLEADFAGKADLIWLRI